MAAPLISLVYQCHHPCCTIQCIPKDMFVCTNGAPSRLQSYRDYDYCQILTPKEPQKYVFLARQLGVFPIGTTHQCPNVMKRPDNSKKKHKDVQTE